MSLLKEKNDELLYQELQELAVEDRLFIIGGYVRDLILGNQTSDFDLMVERDLEKFLGRSVERFNTKSKITVSKSRFLTAKLGFDPPYLGHESLDFSQARKENYPTPASRPVVSQGTLNEDILRRDFTINSIAIEGDQFVDLSNGKNDLEKKLIRVHHNESFRDDPIRLIRAIRFSSRFNFNLEKNTSELFKKAQAENFLSLVSPRRRYEELKKVLAEPLRETILSKLHELQLLPVLCPAIIQTPPKLSSTLSIDEMLLSLVDRASPKWSEYVDSLGLPREQAKSMKK